jgi:uncharacterized protein with HEPN domain
MGDKALIYQTKLLENLKESQKHLDRFEIAIQALQEKYTFPLTPDQFQSILQNREYFAYSDQVIYRFSKLQDTMGAKLFKSILLYQGENTNKPFLDILNQLESIQIIQVQSWFEIRDLRNEIAHNYEENETTSIHLLNTIFEIKLELHRILESIQRMIPH